jgi:hypothetical protein
MRLMLATALVALTAVSLAAIHPAVLTDAERTANLAIQQQRIHADIRFLSRDLPEGCAPGAPTDGLTRLYLASRFEAIGLEPPYPGSGEQDFDVAGVTAGLLRGRDPDLASEAIVYTARRDRAALATLLAVAEAFAAAPERPRRSVLFAALAAEEQAGLDAEQLVKHPPVARLVASVSIGGAGVRGRAREVPVAGLGRTTLDDWIRSLAEAQGRTVVADAVPGEGASARADQLRFARAGVPAIGVAAGGVEDAQLLFFVGAKVADAPVAPSWRPGDEGGAGGKGAVVARGR